MLDVSGNILSISFLESLRHLTVLENLNLSNTGIDSIRYCRMSSLKKLNISNNQVKMIEGHLLLPAFSKLEISGLFTNPLVSEASILNLCHPTINQFYPEWNKDFSISCIQIPPKKSVCNKQRLRTLRELTGLFMNRIISPTNTTNFLQNLTFT